MSRPSSWYAVPQPYTRAQPGQQAPLLPGAPDFPPASVAGRTSTIQGGPSTHVPASVTQHGLPPHSQSGPAAPTHPPAWNPGHRPAQHSHPTLPSHSALSGAFDKSLNISAGQRSGSSPHAHSGEATAPLLPDRPVSPRPQLGDSWQPHRSASPNSGAIPRVHSPQPRRSTLPSLPPTALDHNPSAQSSDRPSSRTARRPLPLPPQLTDKQSNTSAAGDLQRTSSSSSSQSSSLSRNSSNASNHSTSSAGSARRRPLPKPPTLPTVDDDRTPVKRHATPGHAPSVTSGPTIPVRRTAAPASYAAAQAAVDAERQRRDTHVRDVSNETVRNMPPLVAVSDSKVPKDAQIPTFAIDVADGDAPTSSAPSFSFSVAPPSPSLNKATSSDYFEESLPDERHPLPVSSVPMATTMASASSYAFACPSCSKPVLYGRTVNAMGKRWHPDCFVCAQCRTKLEHLEFFTKDGKPYCHVDYHELFSIRCSHCQTPIVDETYVTIDDDTLGRKTYHELHFFCANCGDPFIDPKQKELNPSDYAAKPFTVHKGHAYCESCNIKLYSKKCSKCRKPIVGDILRALNKDWCEECFVCSVCSSAFVDGTFVVLDDQPTCERCYKRAQNVA